MHALTALVVSPIGSRKYTVMLFSMSAKNGSTEAEGRYIGLASEM